MARGKAAVPGSIGLRKRQVTVSISLTRPPSRPHRVQDGLRWRGRLDREVTETEFDFIS